jgi:hypothetical protein
LVVAAVVSEYARTGLLSTAADTPVNVGTFGVTCIKPGPEIVTVSFCARTGRPFASLSETPMLAEGVPVAGTAVAGAVSVVALEAAYAAPVLMNAVDNEVTDVEAVEVHVIVTVATVEGTPVVELIAAQVSVCVPATVEATVARMSFCFVSGVVVIFAP